MHSVQVISLYCMPPNKLQTLFTWVGKLAGSVFNFLTKRISNAGLHEDSYLLELIACLVHSGGLMVVMTTVNQGIASFFWGFYKLRRKLLPDFQAICSGWLSFIIYPSRMGNATRISWLSQVSILTSLFIPIFHAIPRTLMCFFFSLLYITCSSPNPLLPLKRKNT